MPTFTASQYDNIGPSGVAMCLKWSKSESEWAVSNSSCESGEGPEVYYAKDPFGDAPELLALVPRPCPSTIAHALVRILGCDAREVLNACFLLVAMWV